MRQSACPFVERRYSVTCNWPIRDSFCCAHMSEPAAHARRWLVAAAATTRRTGEAGLKQADVVKKHNELYVTKRVQASLRDALGQLAGRGLYERVGDASASTEGQAGKELKLTVRVQLWACGGMRCA